MPCGLAFHASLPPSPERWHGGPWREHWEDADEFKASWHDLAAREEKRLSLVIHEDRVSYRDYYAQQLALWPRCPNCPLRTRPHEFQPPRPAIPPMPIFCKECRRRAILAVSVKFPWAPALMGASVNDAEEIWIASDVACDTSLRTHAERYALYRSEPRCDTCHALASAKKQSAAENKKEAEIGREVLRVLAETGVPMNVTQLLDAGIKGLTRNNSSKKLGRLVASGQVQTFTKGPARFFELP